MVFTSFDVISSSIVLISFLFGFYTGAAHIIINLTSTVISIIAAISLYPFVQGALESHLEGPLLTVIVSAVSSYLICLILTKLVSSKILSLIANYKKGYFDRFLGGTLGALRGVIIVFVVYSLIVMSYNGLYVKAKTFFDVANVKEEQYPDWLKNSVTNGFYSSLYKIFLGGFEDSDLAKLETPFNKNKGLDQKDLEEE